MVTVGGNYVALDIGNGKYALYAHVQPGSLRVKVGDRVKRGQVLALLGNSGNSTEPHVHFQIADGPTFLSSEGLPYAIDFQVAWQLRRRRKSAEDHVHAARANRGEGWYSDSKRARSLPLSWRYGSCVLSVLSMIAHAVSRLRLPLAQTSSVAPYSSPGVSAGSRRGEEGRPHRVDRLRPRPTQRVHGGGARLQAARLTTFLEDDGITLSDLNISDDGSIVTFSARRRAEYARDGIAMPIEQS